MRVSTWSPSSRSRTALSWVSPMAGGGRGARGAGLRLVAELAVEDRLELGQPDGRRVVGGERHVQQNDLEHGLSPHFPERARSGSGRGAAWQAPDGVFGRTILSMACLLTCRNATARAPGWAPRRA